MHVEDLDMRMSVAEVILGCTKSNDLRNLSELLTQAICLARSEKPSADPAKDPRVIVVAGRIAILTGTMNDDSNYRNAIERLKTTV